MWQVYVKRRGNWETHGNPMEKESAETLVATLRKKIKDGDLTYEDEFAMINLKTISEPHCVPVS